MAENLLNTRVTTAHGATIKEVNKASRQSFKAKRPGARDRKGKRRRGDDEDRRFADLEKNRAGHDEIEANCGEQGEYLESGYRRHRKKNRVDVRGGKVDVVV